MGAARPRGLALTPRHCLSLPSSKTNALNVSQKMIEMFVRTKHKIDKSHEFALVVVNDDIAWVRRGRAGVSWGPLGVREPLAEACASPQLSGLTSDPRELCSCLYDLETASCSAFSILPCGAPCVGLAVLSPDPRKPELSWLRSTCQLCRYRLGRLTSLSLGFLFREVGGTVCPLPRGAVEIRSGQRSREQLTCPLRVQTAPTQGALHPGQVYARCLINGSMTERPQSPLQPLSAWARQLGC